ncbi:36763_t:CDS:2 [Gigaspora margarita]|uniref:36763_t:CDS:1 n=1 Tax=Gigaspora margarita TaxID=4874 RepID=A0ABN7W2S1_GIGMA|nr:36763_t:CDS:2 [Gigaspora margarita]
MNICEVKTDYIIPNKYLFSEEFDSEAFNSVVFNDEAFDSKAFGSETFDSEAFDGKEFDSEEFDGEEFDSEEFDNFTNEALSEESDKIIDEALNIEKMPSISREFSLYFKNLTEALMFCWIQKYSISTQAYNELVDIIHHLQFKSKDIVMNIRQFRKYRQRLPLLPIKTRKIHILNKNTLSISKNIKKIMSKKIKNFGTEIYKKNLHDLDMRPYNSMGILYKHQGHWKLRDVVYFYKHLSEFAALEVSEMNFSVYKLHIDLYYDDFGTYCNIYHSLGGVYIQIGNSPFNERKHLKNHFVLGFILFGDGTTKKEIMMNVQGNQCLVIASLGDVTADLPQGNDLARVKSYGAIRKCRTCNIVKDSWTSEGLDLSLVSCYYHLTDDQFKEISVALIITKRKELAPKYGLHLQPPILDRLKREKHLQCPHDVYHLTARKVLRFIKITIKALSTIKELVIVADYCGKPRDEKLMQGYKKEYRNLFNDEEPDEYIVKYAKNKFPNKEKYMEMKEQYKQWYRFEPKLLKAIGDLNLLYYKLAKPYFKDLTKIRSEIDNFLDNNEINNIDNIDKFLSEN